MSNQVFIAGKFTAETKKYDPDHEEEAICDSWEEAEQWLVEQQHYGLCSMWINGVPVKLHNGHAVNNLPELGEDNVALAPQTLASDSLLIAVDGIIHAMANFNNEFDRIFRPQPTRGNAPTNPATLGQKVEE